MGCEREFCWCRIVVLWRLLCSFWCGGFLEGGVLDIDTQRVVATYVMGGWLFFSEVCLD